MTDNRRVFEISSGVGLISGIPTADLIEQLLAIDARPISLIQSRSAVLTSQQIAIQDISARLLSLKLSADSLTQTNTFNGTTATSSDPSVLTVSSGITTTPGTYDFTVDRLLTTQQMISRGFQDTDATAVGAATLTVEQGTARLDSNTALSRLNASNGVTRGKIRITDRSGTSEIVDLSKALSVNDVINTINDASTIDVTASVDGDHFDLTDNTGATTANLTVANLAATDTATDLGLAQSVAAATITGSDINTVGTATQLSALNDRNGVRISAAQDDFQILQRDNTTFNVNIAGSETLGDVIDAINAASTLAGGSITAAINDDATGLKLTDASVGATSTTVTALNSSGAAADLGLLGNDYDNDGVHVGDRVIAGLNSTLMKNLLGGTGIPYTGKLADYDLTAATPLADFFDGAGLQLSGDGSKELWLFARDTHAISYQMDLDPLATTQDLIDEFNTLTGGKITLSIEGLALRATDNTGSTAFDLRIQDIIFSNASNLGIAVIGPVSTILGNDVNPTRAVTSELGPGQINITNRAGTSTEVDLTTARSISDVISLVNNSGAGVTAALNGAGNGLTITDTSGGSGNLVVADVAGSFATDTGLAGTFAADSVDSGNLQRRYISESTLLTSLNGGKGVASGKFTITDSSGNSGTVDLTQGNEVTIQDVLDEINSRGLAITARVNDNGDGILIEGTGSGGVKLKVEESGSTTAADLGLLGEAENAGDDLDGSFEKTITIDADDTLQDLVDKVNDAGAGVRATILNDGSGVNPFRVSLLSAEEGSPGSFVFDDGALDLQTQTLVEASNAVVFFGSTDPASAIAIESPTNSLNSLIPGATISLLSTSTSPVRVTVSQDQDGVISTAESLVSSFNDVVDTLNKYDTFDPETEVRGLLLGDSTVARIRSAVYRIVFRTDGDLSGQYNNLAQLGFKVGGGAKLSLDSTKLRDALENDIESVQQLFTLKETTTDAVTGETTTTAAGIGVDFAELLANLTDSNTGTIASRLSSIDNQLESNNDRIDRLDLLLDAKRLRLQTEFNAMEQTLALLQRQASALSGIQNLSSSTSSLF